MALLIVAVLTLTVGTHFWIADRQSVLRTLFPVQALLSPQSCSKQAPLWLQHLSETIPYQMRALSNQLVWIDGSGREHHCETGWAGTPFTTAALTDDVRFRYGSLTKPLVSAALLELDRRGTLPIDTTVTSAMLDNSAALTLVDSRVKNLKLSHLLEHRAGLVGRLHQIFIRDGKPWCPHALTKIADARLHFAPGSQSRYENINYCLVGEAIAVAEGQPVGVALDRLLSLQERGIGFVGEANAEDEVLRDYRNNPFYSATFTGNFDYQAITATAGMSGSALAYARLMRELLLRDYPGYLASPESAGECDSTALRSCFGRAFFSFTAENAVHLNVKDGYLPGTSALVVITPSDGVFVWLGNADIPGVVEGQPLRWLLNEIARHAE
ncbi:beta-lactamase family protein [Microbulbifer agarilyticus]|uniref:serine hydrolase domain-containing protein n=1 Tax=Microbulbifer agarilyticus TaxID=260552 RepID=UPI001C950827|nr:serine hydrolase domain-containing protein [Microbulbifer agarilyticus]MBY6191408.1 beta-lactamase family protein [Microbulbifer agarilyticus]